MTALDSPSPSEVTLALFDARVPETPETVEGYLAALSGITGRVETAVDERVSAELDAEYAHGHQAGTDDGRAEALEGLAGVVAVARALVLGRATAAGLAHALAAYDHDTTP